MEFGEKLKLLRKDRDYTLKELAEKTDLSISFLSDIENGRRKPGIDNLKKIAKGLDITPYDLLSETDMVTPIRLGKLPSTPEYTLTEKEEKDVAKDLEKIISNLDSDDGLAYLGGEPMDEETKELMKISLENSMRLAKQLAKKKFTPKKYK